MSAVASVAPTIYEDCCSICTDEIDKYKTAKVNGRWSFVSGTDSNNHLIINNDLAARFILKNCCHAIHKKCFNEKSMKSCPTCRIPWVSLQINPANSDIEANRALAGPEEQQSNRENICCMIICLFVASTAFVCILIYVVKKFDPSST